MGEIELVLFGSSSQSNAEARLQLGNMAALMEFARGGHNTLL